MKRCPTAQDRELMISAQSATAGLARRGGYTDTFSKFSPSIALLDIVHLVDKDILILTMEGHILAEGQIMGRYQKK